MKWTFLIHLFLNAIPVNIMAQPVPSDKRRQYFEVLTEAVKSSDRFFVKVHAAEALISHQHTEGLEKQFIDLQQASPDNFIGATRVLANVNKTNVVKYKAAVQQILDVFLHSGPLRPRLIALESLGKLGYNEPLPQIRQQAQEGVDGMQPMARWVLANSGRAEDEDQLAAMLDSDDPLTYRYAAYALRFRPSVRSATCARLEACVARLRPDDPQRVYVVSALFIHSAGEKHDSVHNQLMQYMQGESGERYELAEALSRRGTIADIPILTKLLTDSDQDVRVAAANALLWIEK